MTALHRHQLVWLNDVGWRAVQAHPRDPEAAECLQHWATRGLPLVVTQQPAEAGALLALGLAAPLRWGRRKIALQAPAHEVSRTGHFPAAHEVTSLLPPDTRGRWRTVCVAFMALGIPVRVHGSHGWQHLTGEACVHATSDLDLHIAVPHRAAGDAAVALLQAAPAVGPRLDGELVFADGAAVAWREWADWRAGRVDRVLVKRLHGVALEAGAGA